MFVLITPKVLKSRSAVAKRQMQPESSKCDTVVDLPLKDGDFPVRYVKLPEGNHSRS